MKAYIVKTEKRISPFEEHPRDLLILGHRLEATQEQILRDIKLPFEKVDTPSEITDTNEHIIFYDNLYFTRHLLSDFIIRSRQKDLPTVCALKKGVLTLRSITTTQDVKESGDSIDYCLWYIPRSAESSEVSQRVIIDPDESIEAISFPHHMIQNSKYYVPLSTKRLIQIDHWTNLWSCNIGTLFGRLQELKTAPKWKLLGLALRTRSTNRWNVSKLNVKIGRGCDIHPTAYLENTEVGNNVEIGAGAVIRCCKIDDNAVIANNVNVSYSYLGEESHIRDGSAVQFSVLYPGAFLACRFFNVSFAGRNSFAGDGVSITDFRFDGKYIHVMKDGELVDTKQVFLGCCLGHGVYLGSGTITAPGREIQNGLKIFAPKERVIIYGNEQDRSDYFQILTK